MDIFISSTTHVSSDSFSFTPPPRDPLVRLNFWLVVLNVPSCIKLLKVRSPEKIVVRVKGLQEAKDRTFSEDLSSVKWRREISPRRIDEVI
jgi:hypothetical protein